MILDDYGTYEGCRKAAEDFFAERGMRPPFMQQVDEAAHYFVKN